MNLFKEAVLELPARWWRYRKCLKFFPEKRFVVLDLGSGPDCVWGWELAGRYKKYIAIDPLIESMPESNWVLIKKSVVKKIPLPTGSVDVVVSTAFIEHVEYPGEILAEGIRVLKKGGVLVLTTPTPLAKNLLEFLAFRLGWISRREIREHKNYFDYGSLMKLLSRIKVARIKHEYFEGGLNNLLVVTK
jgi:SAM-dependent methyltransferase